MHTIWSKEIQGIKTLDLTREIRFRDDRKDYILSILDLKQYDLIADIGCGPGTISRKLATWLSNTSNIIGIDSDSGFIEFAEKKAIEHHLKNVTYQTGDALNLPLKTDSLDACISHTVIEHLPNRKFLLEQKRVCRSGGKVIVMYRIPGKDISYNSDKTPALSQKEKELWDILDKVTLEHEKNKNISIGNYSDDLPLLPLLFEELGFNNIKIDGLNLPITIDDSRNTMADKLAIINAEKQIQLEGINTSALFTENTLSDEEINELKKLTNNRYQQRIDMLEKGEKLWDYKLQTTVVVSGIV